MMDERFYVRVHSGKIIDANPGTAGSRQSWERVPEGPKPEGPPEYTPTTGDVRRVYSYGALEQWEDDLLILRAKAQDFNRWLASVRADAWDEGNRAHPKFGVNPYRKENQ